jgi:aminocarboxymuconate-semialdehyde decarboxylase
MRFIDAYTHFFPKRYYEALLETPGGSKDLGKRVRGIPALSDLSVRLGVVGMFEDYRQVLSLGFPPVEKLWDAATAGEMAKLANDGLAEIVAKHPAAFVGYTAVLPMNDPAAAAREAERALRNGANGIQLATNANGLPLDDPRFADIFAVIEQSGRPILLHPSRAKDMADYPTETQSKYEIHSVLGWPYETSVTLARLVFSGIMDRHPTLKVMAHHLGGVVPMLAGRVGHSWDQLGSRTTGENYEALLKTLKKRPHDYFKDFYADTAVEGARGATLCGIDFFGPGHVLFASDCPFDIEKGPGYIRSTIAILTTIGLPEEDLARIAHKNAESLFHLA